MRQELAAAGFALGDRVCALVAGGGYAELCVAPLAQCLPVPKGLSDIEAASLPETFFTVWQNVFHIAGLQAGEWLLVQGGSSGIGVTAIQLAKALGRQGHRDGRQRREVRSLRGRWAPTTRSTTARRISSPRSSASPTSAASMSCSTWSPATIVAREIECLAADGRVAIIAVQGGTQSALDVGAVLRKRLSITGSTLRPRTVAYKGVLAQALRERVWPLIEAGRIKPVIHQVFPAAQAAAAHALMESSTHVGKIVLDWTA